MLLKRLMTPAPALLIAVLAVAGCSDSPAGPARPRLAAVEPSAGDGQTALAGEAVPTAPAVRVSGSDGRGIKGVTVSFRVTQGGGTVAHSQALSNADGIATAGQWTLGAEGINEVEARVGLLSPVRFTATAMGPDEPAPPPAPPAGPPLLPPPPPPAPAGSYSIRVRYVNAVSPRQQQAVEAAVAKWQSVILGDLTDIPLQSPAGSCFTKQVQLNETIDDLVLYVEFVPIDGAGATLGESGPCYVRSESGLPVLGYVKLDSADLLRMEQSGTLDDVVLHEIGHVLGIGTLWDTRGLLQGAGGTDPRFTGVSGIAAYAGLGGVTADVAVENTGGTGTRDSHWRETEFGNELMTGYISSYPNPLSTLTIASLQDLGYGASQAGASSYVLGGTAGHATEAVDLRGRERLHKPRFKVDHTGRKQRLQP